MRARSRSGAGRPRPARGRPDREGPSRDRRVRTSVALALVAAATAPACTLAKPLLGAVAAPVQVFGQTGTLGGCCDCDCGEAVVGVLAICAGIGAGAGLVTGVISDFNAVMGYTDDPCRNWSDPFATNAR